MKLTVKYFKKGIFTKIILFLIVYSHSSFSQERIFKILSIDGGGVRGIIPAKILHEIEKRTGKPISKTFDLIVGNSTGGVIALALVKPNKDGRPTYSAIDILNMYLNRSSEIFYKSIWKKITSGGGIWGTKYERENYDKILKQMFGNVKMSEALTSVVAVSYSIEKGLPHFWSSIVSKSDATRDYYMRDIAGATSAAPTFFAPKIITKSNGEVIYEVDGGIYANNPEMVGVLEAFKRYSKLQRKNIILISIGTGKVLMNQTGKDLTTAGAIGWVINGNLIDVMMVAVAELEDSQAQSMFNKYHRLQIDLPKKNSEMDNSDPENLEELLKISENFIHQNDKLIDHICGYLKKPLGN